jgi:predicted PurR-regulated permease PerM
MNTDELLKVTLVLTFCLCLVIITYQIVRLAIEIRKSLRLVNLISDRVESVSRAVESEVESVKNSVDSEIKNMRSNTMAFFVESLFSSKGRKILKKVIKKKFK